MPVSHSLKETEMIAHDWLDKIVPSKTEATVVGLYGNLGSGKTAFTQALAKKLGIAEFVTSPTFVIMKKYPTTNPNFKTLVHIDAYRLSKGEELGVLGFEKEIKNPENLVLVEWPENVKSAMPAKMMNIRFEAKGETERDINI